MEIHVALKWATKVQLHSQYVFCASGLASLCKVKELWLFILILLVPTFLYYITQSCTGFSPSPRSSLGQFYWLIYHHWSPLFQPIFHYRGQMSFLHNTSLLLIALKSKHCVTAVELDQHTERHPALGKCESEEEVYDGHRLDRFRGKNPVGVAASSIGNSSLFYVSFLSQFTITRVNYYTNQTHQLIQPITSQWKPFLLNYDSPAYGLLVMRSNGLFNISHPEANPDLTSLDDGVPLLSNSPHLERRAGFVRIKGFIWAHVGSETNR